MGFVTQLQKCRRGIAGEDLMDALSLTRERVRVGFQAAARYANTLAQKVNLDPRRFRQARLHPLPNFLP